MSIRLIWNGEGKCGGKKSLRFCINHKHNEPALLNYADKAMYQAKREGCDQVRFYEGT